MDSVRCSKKAITMHNIIRAMCSIVIISMTVVAENDYFPGLRRTKPSQNSPSQWVTNDARDAPELLKSINELIEGRARQRFLEHLQRLQLDRSILQTTQMTGPAFTYQASALNNPSNPNDPIDFAVGPTDPRFHALSIDMINANNDIAPEQMHGNPNVNLPPSPQDIKPKLPINFNQHLLENKIRQKELRLNEHLLPQRVSGVSQRPVEMDGAMAMYIVALIGGISAAVTVGLVFSWYWMVHAS